MFLRGYRDLWLDAEEDIRAQLIKDLCDDPNEVNEPVTIPMGEETEADAENLAL
ncbi:unnamed protein product, partial [Rotaria magnacalcarata]